MGTSLKLFIIKLIFKWDEMQMLRKSIKKSHGQTHAHMHISVRALTHKQTHTQCTLIFQTIQELQLLSDI